MRSKEAGKGAGGDWENPMTGLPLTARRFFIGLKGQEVTMAGASTETIVKEILQREGAQTLDRLWLRSGLCWAQVFAGIDRLSRSGEVWLRRAAGPDYLVSLSGGRE
ncbi:hypothetical protein YTPLAS18_39460 [Nitrospira sp.]|nr:hypothetical protein YTPLAS18_39460 [Nitrospira sp.]